MKSLTTSQSTARAATSRSVQWFCKITWPQPYGARYYSLRDFSPDPSVTVDPILKSLPEMGIKHEAKVEHGITVGETTMTLANLPGDLDRVQNIIDSIVTPIGSRADVYMVFDSEGAISSSDWIARGVYRIENHEVFTDSVRLYLRDYYAGPGDEKIGRLIHYDDFSTAPAKNIGWLIPYIFGTIEECQAYLVETGARSRLDGDITQSEGVISVDDVSVFDATGTVIINDEEISYTSVDATNNTLGVLPDQVTRGANGSSAQPHYDGAIVREKRSRYRCIVCDHHVTALDTVKIEPANIYLDSADYTVTETTFDSHNITYLDLDYIPYRIDANGDRHYYYEEEIEVYCKVNGINKTSPSDLIQHVITDSDFFGLASSYVNTTALTSALSAAGSTSWTMGTRIFRISRKIEILDRLIWQCGIRMSWEDGKFKAFPSLFPDSENSQRSLTRAEMLSEVRRYYQFTDDHINKIHLFYAQSSRDSFSYDGRVEAEETISQGQEWGVLFKRIFAEWHQNETDAQALVDILIRMSAYRRSRTEIRTSLGYIDFEMGDTIHVQDEDSLISNSYGVFIGSSFPDADVQEVQIANLSTRSRLWEYDASNYIDLFTDPLHLQVVMDGSTVAHVRGDGRLWLAGEVIEKTFTDDLQLSPTDSDNGEIEYDAVNSLIQISVKDSGGTPRRVCEFDASGNFYVYEVTELATYPLSAASSPTFSNYYEFFDATTSQDWTLDLLQTYIRWVRELVSTKVNAKFYCREVIENVSF